MTSSYEMLPKDKGLSFRAKGSTRAGLMTASLRALWNAAGAAVPEGAPTSERAFSIKAADAGALLADFLAASIAAGAANQEVYDDVRFDLITDKQAEGAFLGKKAKAAKKPVKAVVRSGLVVAKNEEGVWETTVALEI